MENIIITMKNKWRIVIVVSLAVSCLVFSVSAILPARYSSQISLLVIQKQPADKIDAFSAAKSAEYLSDILSKAVYTDMFFADVMSAPQKPTNQFSSNHEDRKKEWSKEVKTKTINNTGIIEITVLDQSRTEAEKLAQAIAWSFSSNGQKYHGAEDRVEIKLIDGPITSQYPTSPNIFVNAVLGFIAGLIGSVSFIYFFPESFSTVNKKKIKRSGNRRVEFYAQNGDNEIREYPEMESSDQKIQNFQDIKEMNYMYDAEPSKDHVKERLNSLLG
jgi:capsular polysaccharide biosynthesis protein